MSEKIKITVDGKEIEAQKGQTILQAAKGAGIEIPTLCHLEGAADSSTPCLICMVDVEGKGRVRACNTPAEDGQVIAVHSKELDAFRKERLTLLAESHYGDCRAPCNLTCPGGINVQGYVNLIAKGEYKAALMLIKEKNPLPISVGRVCPRFCETRCRRILLDEPIAINHLKRFVADYASEVGFRDDVVGKPTGKRVAIIGGGPAGLSCAHFLRKQGHDVTIFEAEEKLGGLLRYGIPGYKLPNKEVDREVQNILNLGVHVKLKKKWGEDFTIQDLKDQGFDAVFIAVGLSRQKKLEIEGSELAICGLKFLKEVNKGQRPKIGEEVLIVGGGDIAVDAARSARRLGAKSVTVIYPRSRVELPAHQREIEEAEKEGVQFFLMATPLKIVEEDEKLKVEMARTILDEPDKRGIRHPIPMPGSRLYWTGDTVISALGQEGDPTIQSFGEIEATIKLTPRKTIKTHPSTMKTSVEGVYAGGDAATGSRTVIQAVAGGRRAAESIHEYLMSEKAGIAEARFNFTKGKRFEDVDMHNFDGYSIKLNEVMPSRPPERRIGDFDETNLGFSEQMAVREAKRCLQCGCLGLSKCTYRELCVDYKVKANVARTRLKYPVDRSHPFIVIDANKCIGCTRCERSCQYGALELDIKRDEKTQLIQEVSIKLNDSCVSCGACVDACPTGTLSKQDLVIPMFPGQLTSVKSVCTYCGTGCSLDVVTKYGAILEIKADRKRPPNWGQLCVKGRFGYTFYRHEDRLRSPLVRDTIDEPFREVDWDEALRMVAARFGAIKDNFGSDSLGILASSRCTNEENYLLQKLARAAWGTNNVDNCARV